VGRRVKPLALLLTKAAHEFFLDRGNARAFLDWALLFLAPFFWMVCHLGSWVAASCGCVWDGLEFNPLHGNYPKPTALARLVSFVVVECLMAQGSCCWAGSGAVAAVCHLSHAPNFESCLF